MMRKDKVLSRSSVKDYSRIPKPVSDKKHEVKEQDDSTNSRNLRSNSRTTAASRCPIRINRDCLKRTPETPNRVVKRNRPFTQKVKPVGSRASSCTSAVKSRATVPRITTHSCVKPVISTTTTQIPKSTRILRSAVPKSASSVNSSKTDAFALAKISTTNNTNIPTSTRILRSHVSSPRDPKADTTSAKSKIPRFSRNLRSRPSFSEETQSLRKRGALKVAETTSLGKRNLAVGKDLEGDLCSKLKKQELPLPKTKTGLKDSNNLLELRPVKREKKTELDLSKEQNSQEDLKELTKPSVESCELIILVVPQEKSLPSAQLEVEVQNTELQVDEQQPCIKKPKQELEKSGLATALMTEPLVKEQHLEERPLTLEDSEVKILDTKELQGTQNKVQGIIPSLQAFTAVEPPLAKDSLGGNPVTLVKFEPVKAFEDTSTPLAKEVPQTLLIEAKDEAIESAKAFEVTETASPKEIQPSTIEQAILAISDEKPASPQNFQTELPPVSKSEESDNISAVKPRLYEEVTLKTSEVLSQNCIVESSVAIGPPSSSSGKEATLTTSADTSKAVTLVEAGYADQLPNTKPATVVREQSSPETTNVVYEEASDAEKKLPATLLPKDQHSLGEPKSCISLETSSSENTPSLKQYRAVKRPGSFTSADSAILTKKRRSLYREDGQEKRHPLADDFCPPQAMDIVVPAALNQDMEVETSENLASTPIFQLIPAALSIPQPGFSTQFSAPSTGNDMEVSNPEVMSGDQSGQSIIEDIEMSQSVTNQAPLFAIHQLPPPNGGHLFAQRAAQPSFGLNQPGNQQLFGSPHGPGFVPMPPPLPTGALNKTGNPVFSFVNVPQQMNQSAILSGVSFKQNSQQTFGNLPQPTLVNADGTPRKFLSASRRQRRNVANPASTQATPLAIANGSQLGPRQVFGGFSTATPTPMESDDGSNVNTYLGNPNVSNIGNVPTPPPPLPSGVLNKTSNPMFSSGNVLQNQPSPMPVVSFKQNSPHCNVQTRNTQPTLVNANRPPRKFLSANRNRRRNVARPFLRESTQTTPLVFASGSQLGPRQVLSGYAQSSTPRESEDGTNVHIFMVDQPRNVLNTPFVGQNKVQSSLVQSPNDHPMDESVHTTPTFMVGNRIGLHINTCFASSNPTTQAERVVQRALSLPQTAFASTVGTPAPPLPTSVIASKSFTNSFSYANSTNTPRKPSTSKSEAAKLQQSIVVGDNLPGTLHKIYSSSSSLSSNSSTESDCESEIDALIEGLAESVSNCSLENSPELDDIGKLIEKFKTLSITDTSLNAVVVG